LELELEKRPWEGIAHDEALLERDHGQHWWLPSSPAIVVGLALHHRMGRVVDLDRAREAGIAVLERKAGGGAVFLDQANMLCGAVSLPTASLSLDVTESYRWLGDTLVRVFASLGVAAERVEVEAARADRAASPVLDVCYGSLSPHEVTVDGKKLVGLAQIRRRATTLYVLGILLRDQSALADYLLVSNDSARERLRTELARRTVGLETLTSRSASEVVAAVADAMPSAT